MYIILIPIYIRMRIFIHSKLTILVPILIHANPSIPILILMYIVVIPILIHANPCRR